MNRIVIEELLQAYERAADSIDQALVDRVLTMLEKETV